MFGLAIVASLWICVRIAARVARPAGPENSTATTQLQRDAISSVQVTAQDAAGQAAGTMVLLFGGFGVLAAAVFIGVLSFRRTQELDVLAERIRWMADLEHNGPITFPPDRSVAMDPIYRLVADSHDRIRAHIRRLDSERRRGFHVLGHIQHVNLVIRSLVT